MTGARSSSTVAVGVFSGFIGFAILQVGKKKPTVADRFVEAVEALQGVVTEMVKAVLRPTPFGILALVTKIVAGSNWAQMFKRPFPFAAAVVG